MKAYRILILTAIVCGITSCSLFEKDGTTLSPKEKEYRSAWKETIGEIDPNHTWNTANSASLSVSVGEPSDIAVYSLGKEKRTLLVKKHIESSGIITLDIPQGIGDLIAVYKSSDSGDDYKCISVEELEQGTTSIDFNSIITKVSTDDYTSTITSENANALTCPTKVNPKTGNRAKIWGYTSFPGWIWTDISNAMPENHTANGQVNNFELESNGIFYISLIYGVTGNQTAEVGYYYYDPASPSQVTYIPLCDPLAGDYMYDEDTCPSSDEALPKTLWKNAETGLWTPTNFDAYDEVKGYRTGTKQYNYSRKNDDQFNCLAVYGKYGNKDQSKSKIDGVKGLTFQIDAPVGNMVGFYVDRGSFRNHTTASMNPLKYHNAIIKLYDGFRFIGLEDSDRVSEDRRDCNDIVFVMVPGNDGTLPGVRLPYIKDITENKYYNADETWTVEPKYDFATHGPSEDGTNTDLASQKQTWTFAFEDMGTIGDFDFNDVVFRVTPDTETHTAEVVLCAAGGTYESEIYYKKQALGEVHSIFEKSSIVNTFSITTSEKILATIDWPEDYCMEKNAVDFSIYVYNTDEWIILPVSRGETPKAICVAGKWAWPAEKCCIATAYPNFGDWGANYNEKSYWDWHEQPEDGKVLNTK